MKVENIDSARMVVVISQGKGREDRITSLSDKMLNRLREYYCEYKSGKWLFEGPDKQKHINARTLQAVFNKAVEKEELKRVYHFIVSTLLCNTYARSRCGFKVYSRAAWSQK